jgi:hypothetical protein
MVSNIEWWSRREGMKFKDEPVLLEYATSVSLPSARQIQIPIHLLEARTFCEAIPDTLCIIVCTPYQAWHLLSVLPGWDTSTSTPGNLIGLEHAWPRTAGRSGSHHPLHSHYSSIPFLL